MSKIIINYKLSEEGRKASLLRGGDGKEDQVLYAEITPAYLKYATVNRDGEAYIKNIRSLKPEIDTGFGGKPYIHCCTEPMLFNEIQTAEDILKFLQEQDKNAKILEEELKPILKDKLEKWEIKQKAKEDAQKAEKEKIEKERKEREELKLRLENDKKDWINNYGSQFLKDAFGEGYNCQRLYATERAIKEFPEFSIDFDDELSIKDRPLPSQKALYESLEIKKAGYDCDVSWTPRTSDGYDYEDEGAEIICIYNYLGKYLLYKIVK